jgi:hypothetical protein
LKTFRLLFPLLAMSCGDPSDPHSQVMDQIEQNVVLPAGAAQLSDYSRYYAAVQGGRVQAAFVIHPEIYRQSVRDFCASKKVRTFPCSADGKSELPAPGERIWLRTADEIPIPSGGGCEAVTFQYDRKTSKYTRPECNGSY